MSVKLFLYCFTWCSLVALALEQLADVPRARLAPSQVQAVGGLVDEYPGHCQLEVRLLATLLWAQAARSADDGRAARRRLLARSADDGQAVAQRQLLTHHNTQQRMCTEPQPRLSQNGYGLQETSYYYY